MAKTIIQAKDFNTRKDLDDHVINLYGAGTDKKLDVEIRGAGKELARLRLSGSTTVYGVSCNETDARPPTVPVEKVNRGKQTGFGLESNIKNNPNNE